MTSINEQPLEWLASGQRGFGQIDPAMELRFTKQGSDDYSVNETWWFEVSVPDVGLTANFYIAMRPNLKICSAGSWMWTGTKEHQLLADHLNFQTFLPEPLFSGNTITVPQIGLEIDISEPFKNIHIRYRPQDVNVSAELSIRGLFAPVVRANGKHFEQATWTTGWIDIEGRRINVDGPSFRDRSWGEPRRENQLAHPPIGWLYGVLDGGSSAFNLSGCDDPTAGAEWNSTYAKSREEVFFDGWLIRDGELRKIISMSKHTERNREDRQQPLRVVVDFEDDRNESHRLEGTIRTAYNMHFWPNLNTWVGFADWQLDGLKGHGGCQDYTWPHYAKRYWK